MDRYPLRPTAVFRVGEMGVSNVNDSSRSPPGKFAAPEPQESGAGQPSFLWAGKRPTAAVEPVDLPATKRTLMCICMNSSGDITKWVVPSRRGS